MLLLLVFKCSYLKRQETEMNQSLKVTGPGSTLSPECTFAKLLIFKLRVDFLLASEVNAVQPPFPSLHRRVDVAYTLQFQGVEVIAGYPQFEP